MARSQYLIDSNSVIDYLNGKLPPEGNLFINNVVNDVPQISVITKIEVLGYNKLSIEANTILIDFVKACYIFNLDENVVLQTIVLRKLHQIKLPDAIIAATAIVNDLVLITRNTKDFSNISGLKVIDPFSL